MQTELEREPETWTGCHFSGAEMMAFSTTYNLPLVAVWGLETQYMWTVWRKPSDQSPKDFSHATVKDVTISSGAGHSVPQRGLDACISLWIDGLPVNTSLSDLEILIGNTPVRGCHLSRMDETGGAQLNARLPSSVPVGPVPVTLFGTTHSIQVVPIQLQTVIVDVTDAIHIGSKYRIETGGIKVTLEGVEKPGEVSFHLKGREAEIVQIEFKDPVTLKYEYSFYLPHRTPRGNLTMIIRVSARDIPVPIEIA